MRHLQIALFSVAAAALIAALFCAGSETGGTLWMIGAGTLLLDMACIMLWPGSPARSE